MTFHEFGLSLWKVYPDLAAVPLVPADLAQYFLNIYPQYYDCISPTARRIKEISERPRVSQKLWEGNRLKNEKQMIDNDLAESRALLEMDVSIRAAADGDSLHVYEQKRMMDHQAKLQGSVAWEERRQAIEASRLLTLEIHRTLKSLKQDLYDLYAEEYAIEHGDDPEPVKAKKLKLVAGHIEQMEGDFNERGIRYLVQASPGLAVGPADEDADSGPSNSEALQAEAEPVPPPRARVGF